MMQLFQKGTKTMTKTILIPTPLRPFVNNQETIKTNADTLGAALTELTTEFPKLKQHLYDDQNELRKFINIYVNDTDIRDTDGEKTVLNADDEISLVPAIAGGLV